MVVDCLWCALYGISACARWTVALEDILHTLHHSSELELESHDRLQVEPADNLPD